MYFRKASRIRTGKSAWRLRPQRNAGPEDRMCDARLSEVVLDVYSLDGTREADLVVVEAVELLGSWPQSSGRPLPSLPYACGLSGDSGFFPTNSTTPRPRIGRSR